LFNGSVIPVTIPFSDSTGIPNLPDGRVQVNPHGMAIKFHLPDGSETDVVLNSLKFFPVSNGADFRLAEQQENLRTILFCALDRDSSINFEKFLKYPDESDLDSDQTLHCFRSRSAKAFFQRSLPSAPELSPGSTIAIAPASSSPNSASRKNSKNLKKFIAVAVMLWPLCMHPRRRIIGRLRLPKWGSEIMIPTRLGIILSWF
jgi:hypothetical protein